MVGAVATVDRDGVVGADSLTSVRLFQAKWPTTVTAVRAELNNPIDNSAAEAFIGRGYEYSVVLDTYRFCTPTSGKIKLPLSHSIN
nr:MAG: hypothetical protein EDM05_23815 [Leptolyngbya sp. IPPAS B-1204]